MGGLPRAFTMPQGLPLLSGQPYGRASTSDDGRHPRTSGISSADDAITRRTSAGTTGRAVPVGRHVGDLRGWRASPSTQHVTATGTSPFASDSCKFSGLKHGSSSDADGFT